MRAKCKCGEYFEIKLEDLGTTKKCRNCGTRVKLPDKETVARHKKKKSAPKPPPKAASEKSEGKYHLEGRSETPPTSGDTPPPEQPSSAAMKICTQCGKLVTDDSPVCQECGGTLKKVGEGGESEVTGSKTAARGPNLPQLIFDCIRHPSQVSSIGVGGIYSPSFFVQLGAAFLLLIFIPTIMGEIGEGGFSGLKMVGIAVETGLKLGSFGAVVLSLWIMAKIFSSNASFVSILGGLAFVRVLAISLMMFVLLIAGIAAGATAIGILPAGIAAGLLGIAGLVYVGFTFTIQMYFVMGIFDVGCFGAFFMNLMAAFIAGFIQLYVAGIIMKIAL